MMRMSIREFLLADDLLLEQLITALLYRYIDDNACTDLLNQSLKLLCPSLYTNENAIFSKACEKLKQALSIKPSSNSSSSSYERDSLLREAVDLMKQIGYVANLEQVCDMLHTAGCYEAIFELGLTAAERRDPHNVALYHYRRGMPCEDVQGAHYLAQRAECYKCLTDCLTALLRTTTTTGNHFLLSLLLFFFFFIFFEVFCQSHQNEVIIYNSNNSVKFYLFYRV
jgi:nuclear pore complex protein Nup155